MQKAPLTCIMSDLYTILYQRLLTPQKKTQHKNQNNWNKQSNWDFLLDFLSRRGFLFYPFVTQHKLGVLLLIQYKDHRCLCALVFFFGVLNVYVYMKLDCFYIVMRKKIGLFWYCFVDIYIKVDKFCIQ